jgi:hypothetical protein
LTIHNNLETTMAISRSRVGRVSPTGCRQEMILTSRPPGSGFLKWPISLRGSGSPRLSEVLRGSSRLSPPEFGSQSQSHSQSLTLTGSFSLSSGSGSLSEVLSPSLQAQADSLSLSLSRSPSPPATRVQVPCSLAA